MYRFVLLAVVAATPLVAHASGYSDFNTGVAALNRADNQTAIQFLSRALASPDLPENLKPVAHLDLGSAYESENALDLALSHYNASIQLKPDNMLGYFFRSDAYERAGKFDAAAADETAILRLKPGFIDAYLNRANNYEEAGRFDDAIADLRTYITIRPQDPVALFQLGFCQWSLGQFADASSSFKNAIDSDHTFSYAALWLQIAEVRVDGEASSALKRRSSDFDRAKWPWPIVEYYLGQSTGDATLQAASSGDPADISGQKCEAQFYVAEWQVGKKDYAAAKPLLEGAAAACPAVLKRAAAVELQRLVPPPVKP
jgi:lipoprotein NlpI